MVDSSGVGAIVSLYKRVRGQGGEVVVSGLRDQPLAIFRLLRLDRVMIGSRPARTDRARAVEPIADRFDARRRRNRIISRGAPRTRRSCGAAPGERYAAA